MLMYLRLDTSTVLGRASLCVSDVKITADGQLDSGNKEEGRNVGIRVC